MAPERKDADTQWLDIRRRIFAVFDLPLRRKNACARIAAKRHIGGRTHRVRAPALPTLQVVEDGVAMHDLGSAMAGAAPVAALR